MNSLQQFSPQLYARIAGVCYLFIIILGVIGQFFVRDSLIVYGDTATTVNNIAASPSLWRAGIAGDLTMHLLDIPVMVIFYLLLKPVNNRIALLGLVFNIIQTAVLVANKLVLLVPALLLKSTEYQAAFAPEQINAQVNLLIEIHNHGLALGLIFFGFACLVYSYLIIKSGYLPKLIGVLMGIAGCSYLISCISLIIAPEVAGKVQLVLVLCVIGELSCALWLLIKGVNLSKWKIKNSLQAL